jgi:hypothetical protein
LALFDRRRSERVKVLRLPAAKNLHNWRPEQVQ